MKNKSHIAFLIILVAAGFSTLAFVIWPTIYATNAQVTTQPDQVVQDFYASYLSYDGNPLVDHAYRSSKFLSPDMIAYLDGVTQDSMQYDPVLCAQDKPTEISASPARVSVDRATVDVTTSFADHRFAVELVKMENEWLIDKIVCQP